MAEIEPSAHGVAALYSPHTAAIDYVAACHALANEIASVGGSVLLSTPVTAVRNNTSSVQVHSNDRRWTVDRLIVCAGLSSDRIPNQLGAPGDLRIVPFRGEYYELRPEARRYVRGMIYPVPDPRYPFLGVHFTRDVHDRVHVGPNAVLALALEGYRWRDVGPRDLARIIGWPGAWRMARANWRSGVKEMADSLSTRRYLRLAQTYVPSIERADLRRSGSGVRAQAVCRDGSLVDDFVLQPAGAVYLVRNAPSPAATSSLAIAEYVVREAFN
jgi:L-2-hydroxyglutarate oxidase LhgO